MNNVKKKLLIYRLLQNKLHFSVFKSKMNLSKCQWRDTKSYKSRFTFGTVNVDRDI